LNNKKTITTILALSTLVLVVYFIYNKRSTGNVEPNDLPKNLKSAYEMLSKKGYKPKTNPIKAPISFIEFSFQDGEQKFDVRINSNLLITIVEKEGMPIAPIQFYKGDFMQNNYVLAEDNDIVSGVLQIIKNRDYIK
jgi:hypothetical protein